MRHILVIALLFLAPAVAHADWMLEFRDKGSPEVWTTIEKRGDRWCTVKEYLGEYCVNAADLKKKPYVVPDGTQATEYTVNFGGFQTDSETSRINQQAVDDMNSQAKQRDRRMDAERKKYERQQLRKKLDGKSEWSQ